MIADVCTAIIRGCWVFIVTITICFAPFIYAQYHFRDDIPALIEFEEKYAFGWVSYHLLDEWNKKIELQQGEKNEN